MFFQRLWNWLRGKNDELHLHVHVHMTDGAQRPQAYPQVSVKTEVSKPIVVMPSSAVSAEEIAHVVLAGGLKKAVDKAGDGAIEHTTSNGVEDRVKHMKRSQE
jgi:hypothetical protein